MTAPDPVTSPTEDRAGEVAALSEVLEWHALVGETKCFCGWEPNVADAATYDDLGDAIEAEHRAHVASIVAARVEEARAEALAPFRAMAEECASSGCIHLNDLWGRFRAALASPDTTGEATT